MAIYSDIQTKIKADREAGRDVPTVIEEYFLMIAESLDPQKKEEETKSPPPTPDPSSTASITQ
jgi:hypothetical protein